MWVYVGSAVHSYNVFSLALNHGRNEPKYFLAMGRQAINASTEDRLPLLREQSAPVRAELRERLTG